MRTTGLLSVVAAVAAAALAGCGPAAPDSSTSRAEAQDCSALKNMAVVAWADHAGLVPTDRSLSGWVETHPDRSRFAPLPGGAPLDVATLWEGREERPGPWDDLVTYMNNQGTPWLLDSDLDDVVPVDDPQADDPIGWRSCG